MHTAAAHTVAEVGKTMPPRAAAVTRAPWEAVAAAHAVTERHMAPTPRGSSEPHALGSGSRNARGDGRAHGLNAARGGSEEWGEGNRGTLMAANTGRGRPLYPVREALDHCAPVLYNLHYRHTCI